MEDNYSSPDLGTIGTLMEDQVERQFQAAYRQVLAAVQHPESARNPDGWATGEITIKVKIAGKMPNTGYAPQFKVSVNAKTPSFQDTDIALTRVGDDFLIDMGPPQGAQVSLVKTGGDQ